MMTKKSLANLQAK